VPGEECVASRTFPARQAQLDDRSNSHTANSLGRGRRCIRERPKHACDVPERGMPRAPLGEEPGRLTFEIDDPEPPLPVVQHLTEVVVAVMADPQPGITLHHARYVVERRDELAPAPQYRVRRGCGQSRHSPCLAPL